MMFNHIRVLMIRIIYIKLILYKPRCMSICTGALPLLQQTLLAGSPLVSNHHVLSPTMQVCILSQWSKPWHGCLFPFRHLNHTIVLTCQGDQRPSLPSIIGQILALAYYVLHQKEYVVPITDRIWLHIIIRSQGSPHNINMIITTCEICY